jgi:hypothetical protein
VRENCRGKAEEGDGVGDGSGGGGAAVVGSGVVTGDAEGDGESEGEAEGVPDDGAAAPGASGVQAASTVSPAPAARKRAKVRRLVAARPGASEGVQW